MKKYCRYEKSGRIYVFNKLLIVRSSTFIATIEAVFVGFRFVFIGLLSDVFAFMIFSGVYLFILCAFSLFITSIAHIYTPTSITISLYASTFPKLLLSPSSQLSQKLYEPQLVS